MAAPNSLLTAAGAAVSVESHATPRPDAPGPQPKHEDGPGGAAVAEAARRSLQGFFDKLVACEEIVLAGEDAKSVHQMRVATRRLRTSLQVLEGVYDHKLIRRFRRGLRRIAQALGAMRDSDVFLDRVIAHRDSLPKRRRAALAPLIAVATAERARARQELLEALMGQGNAKFKRAFTAFLSTPGKGALSLPAPGVIQRVRDFAGSAIWRRYELWRAYETVLQGASDETLHQARLAGKRLRYAIELFADALGPNVGRALDPLIALQDCLGIVQDGITARSRIAALGLAGDLGAQSYLAACDAERVKQQIKLPRLWAQVASVTYQRRLFKLIVSM
jgi:CHAD domain-containing protein